MRILCSHNVKVAQKPFLTLNHIFAKPKDSVPKEQKSDAIYIPSRAMTVVMSTSDRLNVSLGHVLKEHQKAVSLSKKDNSALSEHTCQTNHTSCQGRCLGAWYTNSAYAPLNRDDGGLLPDAYLHLING